MAIKPKHNHSDRDRIFTPEEIVKRLVKKIPHQEGDSWCDCCYGKGVFFNNFPCIDDHKDFFEIDMGKDFLAIPEDYGWDWIVTNIPFSKPKEFIFKMAKHCNKGFGILCLANSMTATRIKELENMGLFIDSVTTIYIKDLGFGYRTDFYVFTRSKNPKFECIIQEKKKKFGDWRDLPDKDYKQCDFCGKFFTDVEKHKNKVHGGKEQQKLTQ